MRADVALLCALALLAARLPEAGALVVPAGTIFLDTVNRWTLADSPVFLNGLLTIDRGATLTVDPGVVVNCTTTASSILVKNVLRIQGTVNLPVRLGGDIMTVTLPCSCMALGRCHDRAIAPPSFFFPPSFRRFR
jgi:hypothetical protein